MSRKEKCHFMSRNEYFIEKTCQNNFSILGPLGYEPNALPLRYPD